MFSVDNRGLLRLRHSRADARQGEQSEPDQDRRTKNPVANVSAQRSIAGAFFQPTHDNPILPLNRGVI